MDGALRISQLDSLVLDEELLEVLKSQLSRCLALIGAGTLSSLLPELTSILRIVIWLLSVWKYDATLGQQMLNVKYANCRPGDPNGTSDAFYGLNRWQKIAYGTVFVFGRYFRDKAVGLEVLGRYIRDQNLVRKFTHWIESGWNLAQLINFLIFLQHGRYQTLMERILRLNTVLSHKQPVRQLTFEFMNRELLWHSFAEFTFFLLPLVNWRKLRNTVNQVFDSRTSNSAPSTYTLCGICEHPPTTPHQSSCGHIFCYYCIKANCMADPGFTCPLCSSKVQSIIPAHKGVFVETLLSCK